ncbi:hypothetical protein ACH5RR_019810 [Cinchona calisaya]|uniref:AB hydrolase-1 domain-containing protein n=1 Tax=Cinchona calisaya TaxID=153742 RepID=A0ABD2ZQE2_9GENT
MPFCQVSSSQNGPDDDDAAAAAAAGDNGIKIFYRTYGQGPIKVLMIIGLAGTHTSWEPQIRALAGTLTPNDEESLAGDRRPDGDNESLGIEVCAFDNRGMGSSSVPTKNSAYTTTLMAGDAIAIMDHLGWKKAHVFGHSMGGMIACKMAAMVPSRVSSLALLNVTGGGYECIPKLDRQTLSIAIRFLRAKTPQQRAAVDLDTHYSKEYLEEYVGTQTRRAILYQEYVKGISSTGMQTNYGFEGQINACWTHKVTLAEFEAIRAAGFLVSVIHGRHDVIAQLCHAKRIAVKLYPSARMVELHGGHLVSHERTEEVNKALLELIKESEEKLSPYDWTNLPMKIPGWKFTCLKFGSINSEGGTGLSFMVDLVGKLHASSLYLFGLFVLAFEGLSLFMPPCNVVLHCDLEVDYESERKAHIVYSALAVDKELQPDKVKREMSISNGKLSVHFEAIEARFLRASFSAFVDVLTLATKTIEEFDQGMEL